MTDKDGYGNCPEESDLVYEQELEKGWGENFDDLDSSFWEKYYGGPDYEEENEEEDIDDEFEENEEKILENLLSEYVSLSQKFEDIKEKFEELREKIAEQLQDDEIINYEGFYIKVAFSKTWEFSKELQALIEKVKVEKKREIKDGIAKLKNINRYIKGQKTKDKIREEFPRAYMPWSQEEDEALLSLSNRDVLISEISQIHQRQKSAIRARIKKLKAV